MNETQTVGHPATCPRCGYDQRGVIATWTDRCPMTGTCTECGLNFDWPQVVSDKLRKPAWCVEYAQSWRFFTCALKTLALTFWPWGFWDSLKMSHPPRWRRIVAYLMVLYLMPLVALPLLNGIAAVKVWTLFKFGQTQSMPTPPPLMRGVAAGGSYVNTCDVSLIEAFLRGVFMPLSPVSPGTVTTTITVPKGIVQPAVAKSPYPSSVSRLESIIASRGTDVPSPQWIWGPAMGTVQLTPLLYRIPVGTSLAYTARWIGACMTGGLPFVLISILAAAAFASLPQSRRQAKVRWTHIFRISLYSMALLVIPCTAYLLGPHLLFITSGAIDIADRSVFALAVFSVPAWFVWWSVATDRFLKMRHPWGVGLAVMIIAVLLAGAILFYGEHIIKGRDPFHYSW